MVGYKYRIYLDKHTCILLHANYNTITSPFSVTLTNAGISLSYSWTSPKVTKYPLSSPSVCNVEHYFILLAKIQMLKSIKQDIFFLALLKCVPVVIAKKTIIMQSCNLKVFTLINI